MSWGRRLCVRLGPAEGAGSGQEVGRARWPPSPVELYAPACDQVRTRRRAAECTRCVQTGQCEWPTSLVMVDPLKVFWVLTNSTYLGKHDAPICPTTLANFLENFLKCLRLVKNCDSTWKYFAKNTDKHRHAKLKNYKLNLAPSPPPSLKNRIKIIYFRKDILSLVYSLLSIMISVILFFINFLIIISTLHAKSFSNLFTEIYFKFKI